MRRDNKANPFVKWVGGKRHLINDLIKVIPEIKGDYYEPFVGGGAVFFGIDGQRRSFLNDINPELINCYQIIAQNEDTLDELFSILDILARLDATPIDEELRQEFRKETFLTIRSWDRWKNYGTRSKAERAARFIYLNRSCFNGLYRVNASGHFNVPYGRYKNPRILDKKGLTACHKKLSDAIISNMDYKMFLSKAKAGDFVYLDPPYVPLSDTASFTSYSKEGFGKIQQEELLATLHDLDQRGVKWILSNSLCDYTLDIYSSFERHVVMAARNINANKSGRKKIKEILVSNFKLDCNNTNIIPIREVVCLSRKAHERKKTGSQLRHLHNTNSTSSVPCYQLLKTAIKNNYLLISRLDKNNKKEKEPHKGRRRERRNAQKD